ncbi:MAG TPA: aminotransferase class V-fold PLP-dependent enzyme [Acidobacteriota bacterium]|nr:aminotransferase class V-fold PLP-dependent enzyme [Acidobacteriota bacterium]HNT18050.1 aminotransferase class V-fold PLP-dependent enzyme [Acidobacteriota bacterium]HPA27089.1 aminotransferase class V-fold PLP-dependent enzyme [Acidobacteriota bacterium]HQO18958.1 aminotransferase class V-fold PLP-dependent enzyme [Acidobacteriota bacterium]HQQ46382.1 aminotransferase class V-fold PLP-dependent enzyme [Acidobacteriota bacterium]
MRLHDGAVYLDANATVPQCREALEAMLEAENRSFANPSAPYPAGKKSRETLDSARASILSKLGLEGRLVFTGSGTEANHLAILSAAAVRPEKRVLMSAIEHPSCLGLIEKLRGSGVKTELFGIDVDGTADLSRLGTLLEEPASLVVLMCAHNETGVVQPVARALEMCRGSGVQFHTDAVQAFGKIRLPLSGGCPDTLSIAAHKIGGPKGIGALFFREGTEIIPMLSGGGQEGGLRASTEAVPLAAAFAAAAEAADHGMFGTLAEIRDMMEEGIRDIAPDADFHGKSAPRLPNTSFFSLPGIDGRKVQQELAARGFFVGTGSACHGAGSEIPAVLVEMKRPAASFPLRVSISRQTTGKEIEGFLEALAEAIKVV